MFTKEELLRIGEICFANNVFVVSDEIHADLARAGQTHIPFAKLFPGEKRIITCTSPSKTFNIAGNNHAHLMIPDENITVCRPNPAAIVSVMTQKRSGTRHP